MLMARRPEVGPVEHRQGEHCQCAYQTGSLTYNGSAQSPTWSGYDASKMTLGEPPAAPTLERYAATFTPKANYQWTDGTTAAKEATWTIGRATVSTLPSQSGP